MARKTDKHLSGQLFGWWSVIREAAPIRYYRRDGSGIYTTQKRWLCMCLCGNHKDVVEGALVSGASTHCGCRLHGTALSGQLLHGMSDSPTYWSWVTMLRRCTNPNDEAYSRYGGRGITVDPRWRYFIHFFADMGVRPSEEHTLDRKDNDGPYCKDNCRWATMKEQSNNRRTCHLLTLDNRTLNITQWAEELGVDRGALYARKRMGWSDEDTLTRPIENKRNSRAGSASS